MRSLTIVFAVAIACCAPAASACSCRTPPPPAEHFAEVDMVFKAEVVKIEHRSSFLGRIWFGLWNLLRGGDISDRCRQYGKRITFQVSEAWKGVRSRSLQLLTARGSAECGYEFEVGRSYLIYAASDETDACNVSLCSRTGEMESVTEDLRFLASRPRLVLQ